MLGRFLLSLSLLCLIACEPNDPKGSGEAPVVAGTVDLGTSTFCC